MYSRGGYLAFVDFLFILLLAFISMFILALLLINPVAKKSEVERKAEYIIVLEWDKHSDDDVDLWVQDPEGKIVLGSFSTYSRHCGPRETIFSMLCRKNMGCSHYIICREHSEVESLYSHEENYRFLESQGDLGIKPIFFEEIGYSPTKKEFVKANNFQEIISQTQILSF